MNTERTRWFHGTTAELSPGDRLVPGGEINVANFEDGDPCPEWRATLEFASTRVWVTPHLHEAAYYAAIASAGPAGDGGTPFIYEVKPTTEPVPAEIDVGWHCDSATIVESLQGPDLQRAARAAADAEPDPDWILGAWADHLDLAATS